MLDETIAKEKLNEILSRREYQAYNDETKSIFAIWWEKVKAWLAEQLAKLFPSIESAGNAAGPILVIFIIIVIVTLAIIAFSLIRNSRRRQIFKEKKTLQTVQEINWSFQRHLAEAKKLEALGNYKKSTRHLFLALLLFFHEKEWLEARIWKTNWEYYDELRKVNKQWAERFYHLAILFDEITYGGYEIQNEEYTKFHKEVMVWLDEMQMELLVEN